MSAPRKTAAGWEMWVTATVDGKRRRRHLRARTRAAVLREADETRAGWRSGELADGGEVLLGAWLESWVKERTVAGVRPSTLSGYRTDRKHLAPLAEVQLQKLTPERISRLWADLLTGGLSAGSVRHVRRTLSAALTTAVDRGRIARNPARLAPCPRDATPEVTPLSADEIAAVLTAAGAVRNGTRWVVGLALGLRQGEVLGLQWGDLDLDAGNMRVRRSIDRPRWRHGCPDPNGCGVRAASCPRRTGGGGSAPLKTLGSARSLAIPTPLVTMLRAHRAAQARERLAASELWEGGDWVFPNAFGRWTHHRSDWEQWRRLLASAGIARRVRIHDLRHTAATLHLVSGTDSRVVQGLFGWTSPTLVARYAHVVDEARRQAADRLGATLWPNQASRGSA